MQFEFRVINICNPAICIITFLGFVSKKINKEEVKSKPKRPKPRLRLPRTNKKLAKALGKRIKELRKSKNLSLKHFEALDYSMNRHALSDIENGKRLPSLITAFRIAQILNVPVSDLFKDINFEF